MSQTISQVIEQAAKKLGKKVWMSESGPMHAPVKGNWDKCLWMGEKIVKDLRYLKAVAWIDWQFIDGGVWGSLNPHWKNRTYKVSKRFYIQCHFSRFIRPGWTIVDADDENALAAIDSQESTLVVVLVNTKDAEKVNLDISRFRRGDYTAAIHTTTEKENLKSSTAQVRSSFLELTLPAKSIITVILERKLK